MKKIVMILCLIFIVPIAWAEGYSGVGIGLSEACRTKYEPSFAGGDCISPNIDVRGIVGNEINKYFSIEASLDASFDAGDIIDALLSSDDSEGFFYNSDVSDVSSKRWSIISLALHAFGYLPLTDSMRLFAGPSVAASMTDFDYDVKYFGDDNYSSHSKTRFGFNYGLAAGIDFAQSQRGFMRVQWQNFRSFDADVPYNGEFNNNTLTFNWVKYY